MQRRAFLASVAGIVACALPKRGATICVKKPPRYVVRDGSSLACEPLGMAVRCVSFYDFQQDRMIMRMDAVMLGMPTQQMLTSIQSDVMQKMVSANNSFRKPLVDARIEGKALKRPLALKRTQG